jgi:hypothetical protein
MVFVKIERRYGYASSQAWLDGRQTLAFVNDADVVDRLWKGDEAAVVETRDLVFLKDKRSAKLEQMDEERVVKRMSRLPPIFFIR